MQSSVYFFGTNSYRTRQDRNLCQQIKKKKVQLFQKGNLCQYCKKKKAMFVKTISTYWYKLKAVCKYQELCMRINIKQSAYTLSTFLHACHMLEPHFHPFRIINGCHTFFRVLQRQTGDKSKLFLWSKRLPCCGTMVLYFVKICCWGMWYSSGIGIS